MSRRVIVAALVIAAVVALAMWMSRHVYWEEVSAPIPLRGEARTNPFYAAQKLVEHLGARSERRQQLGELPDAGAVIYLKQWHWSLIQRRQARLEEWVQSGGRLVIEGPLVGGEDEFYDWTGLSVEYPLPEKEEGDETPVEEDTPEEERGEECRTLDLAYGEPILEGVVEYTLCNLAIYGWLASEEEPRWALEDDAGLQAVRVQVGEGEATLLNVQPFGNRNLLAADNARLLAEVLQLRQGDLVIFASEEDHASLLALIWKYGAPIVILTLLLIAAALWRGAVRFGPLQSEPALSRRSLAEQIRGTGHFVMRAGAGQALHAAMVRALHEAAQRRIPNYARLGVAERIEAVSALSGVDAEQLASDLNAGASRQGRELKRTLMQIERARTRLQQNTN